MKASTPVLLKPAIQLPELDLAAGNPSYLPLPALIGRSEGTPCTCRFKLTLRERLRLLWHGNIWLCQLTFGHNYPPVRVTVEEPSIEDVL